MDRLFNTALTLMQTCLRENSSRGDCLSHRQHHSHDRHLAETATKYVEEIVEDGHKTVIRMSSAGSLADTNPNFKTLQECLEWVQTRTVSH